MRTQSLKTKATALIAATAMALGFGAIGIQPASALGNGKDPITTANGQIIIKASNITGATDEMTQYRQFKAYRVLDYTLVTDSGVNVDYSHQSSPTNSDDQATWKAAVNAGAAAANKADNGSALTGTDTIKIGTEDVKVAKDRDEVQTVLNAAAPGSNTVFGQVTGTGSAAAAYAFANTVYGYKKAGANQGDPDTNVFADLTADVSTGDADSGDLTKCKSGTGTCFTWNDTDKQWESTANLQYGYYLVVETASTATGTSQGGQAIASYLILTADVKSTDGNKPQAVTLYAKSDTPTSTKYISSKTDSTTKKSSTTEYNTDGNGNPTPVLSSDANSASSPDFSMGDTIWYTLTFTIPSGYLQDFKDNGVDFNFTMQDHLSKGLTYDETQTPTIRVVQAGQTTPSVNNATLPANVVEVKNTAADADFLGQNETTSEATAGQDTYLKWKFTLDDADGGTDDYLKMSKYLPGATVYLTYKATMNGNAVIGSKGNPNDYNVKYDRNPRASGDASYTPTKSPKVYTYGLKISKQDSNDSTKYLNGVTFCLSKTASKCSGADSDSVTLYGTDGDYHLAKVGTETGVQTIKTNSTAANLKISGLDAGEYYLWEITPLASYQSLGKAVKITIAADADTQTKFNNNDADAGTNIFYPSTSGTAAKGNTVQFTQTGSEAAEAGDHTITTWSATDDAVVVKNTKVGTLPITGGQGIALAVIVGLGLVGVGAVVTKRSRKEDALAE